MKEARPAAPELLVVVTTVGTQEQALDIANHLVEHRLAACVNILPGVRSIFRWKGQVSDDTEYLLLVKSVRERYDEVAAAIKALHAYELPEILAHPATIADAAFASWVVESTTPAEAQPRSRK